VYFNLLASFTRAINTEAITNELLETTLHNDDQQFFTILVQQKQVTINGLSE